MHFQVQGMWLVRHFFHTLFFQYKMGTIFVSCFIQSKNQHKDDHEKGEHENEHKEGEKKYEHKDQHTKSIEISMVEEGDIVVSIWDLVGQDEYHAIK